MPISIRNGANALGGTEDRGFWVRTMLDRRTPVTVHDRYVDKEFIPTNGGIGSVMSRFAPQTTSSETMIFFVSLTLTLLIRSGSSRSPR